MRTLSSELQALLASRTQLRRADLYTITLLSGTVLRWTSADRDQTFDGTTWSRGPGLRRSSAYWTIGLEAAELTVSVYPGDADTIHGESLHRAVNRGEFDGAWLVLQRGLAAGPSSDLVGVVDWFAGRIADLSLDSSAITLRARSPLELLESMWPPNVYLSQCWNRLFDGVCGLNATTYRESGSVVGSIASNRTSFIGTITKNPSTEAHWFRLGRVQFTSGKNAGRTVAVKAFDAATGRIDFATPWIADIEAGDTFYAWPGCDKTLTTCGSKYANTVHFRGTPFVPAAETVA